jgi:hypothetical protein
MHFNPHFTTVQVIWTLTIAALLVLLVVLLGRERMHRYPWFTTSIVLMSLRLLASRELYGRMAPLTLSAIFIALGDLGAVVGLLVLVEMARRAFAGAQRSLWIVNAVGMVVVAGGILAAWGPWPAWKTLTADSHLTALRLMQLFAARAETLVELLTVGLCLVVVLFGRRYQAGWRSHTQQIVIGLSTAALAQLTVQTLLQRIAQTATPHSQAEYERIVGFQEKAINASSGVFVAVLVWWIVCLWIDEPGTPKVAEGGAGEAAEAAAETDADSQDAGGKKTE